MEPRRSSHLVWHGGVVPTPAPSMSTCVHAGRFRPILCRFSRGYHELSRQLHLAAHGCAKRARRGSNRFSYADPACSWTTQLLVEQAPASKHVEMLMPCARQNKGKLQFPSNRPPPPPPPAPGMFVLGGGGCSSDAGHGELPPHDREKGSNTRGERTGILLLPCRPTAKAPPSPSVVLSLPPPAQTAFRAANPIAQASQACRCVYSATNIPRSPRRPSNTTYFVLNLSGSFDLLHSCNVEVECSG